MIPFFTFTVLCSCHHCLFPNLFYHSKQRPLPPPAPVPSHHQSPSCLDGFAQSGHFISLELYILCLWLPSLSILQLIHVMAAWQHFIPFHGYTPFLHVPLLRGCRVSLHLCGSPQNLAPLRGFTQTAQNVTSSVNLSLFSKRARDLGPGSYMTLQGLIESSCFRERWPRNSVAFRLVHPRSAS